jgi:L-lactate dehydrogenase complex protein LldE
VRIGLFITCIGATMFPETGRATVAVLERLGHEVVFPAEQTCCGQMHLNSGYVAEADRLARRFKGIFAGFDAVVSPSSSCAGTMRQHSGLENVYELSEFLVHELGVEDVGAHFPHRVTYHPTCHSLRVIRVGDAPYRLLEHVHGLELVELPRSHECCGFGGTFSIKNSETSTAMLADKCTAIESTGSKYCTALDASCLMQIGGGLSRARSSVRPIHLAQILALT